MKIKILLFFTILALINVEAQDDISKFLKDRPYVQKQLHCILDRGHCDVIGKKIKELLPEVLNNHCNRCTSRQIGIANTLIPFMQQNYPYEWQLILRRYKIMKYY